MKITTLMVATFACLAAAGAGAQTASSTPGEFSALIRAETDRWTKVIKAAGTKGE